MIVVTCLRRKSLVVEQREFSTSLRIGFASSSLVIFLCKHKSLLRSGLHAISMMLAARQHFYLLCIATTCMSTGIFLTGLAYGMDHWRILRMPFANDTIISQGMLHECAESKSMKGTFDQLKCLPIQNGRTIWRMRAQLDFVKTFLLTTIFCGVAALILSSMACLSEKPRFNYLVNSLEAIAAIFSTVAIVIYGRYFFDGDWSIGWCFFVSFLCPLFSSIACAIHVYVGDVSCFGKKVCKTKSHLNTVIEL